MLPIFQKAQPITYRSKQGDSLPTIRDMVLNGPKPIVIELWLRRLGRAQSFDASVVSAKDLGDGIYEYEILPVAYASKGAQPDLSLISCEHAVLE